MGKVLARGRMEHFFRIWECINDHPFITVNNISQKTGVSRNTVAVYLEAMTKEGIMTGPSLTLNSSPNYREYVCLAQFEDPLLVYDALETFPRIVYHALSFGRWNTFLITRGIDISKLVGFKEMVFQEMKYRTITPQIQLGEWGTAFRRIRKEIDTFGYREEKMNRELSPLNSWGKEEWLLYRALHRNLRMKKTPELRKTGVRYEVYDRWKGNLENYCTVHTCFYPLGYANYTKHCFLFSSDYEGSLMSLFSLLPVSSTFLELEKHFLLITPTPSPRTQEELFCLVLEMEKKGIIRSYKHSFLLSHSWHDPDAEHPKGCFWIDAKAIHVSIC